MIYVYVFIDCTIYTVYTYLCVSGRARVRVCVRACVCACVRVCMCMYSVGRVSAQVLCMCIVLGLISSHHYLPLLQRRSRQDSIQSCTRLLCRCSAYSSPTGLRCKRSNGSRLPRLKHSEHFKLDVHNRFAHVSSS